MDKITTVGIELAKRVFALYGVDETGRVVLRNTADASKFKIAEPDSEPACSLGKAHSEIPLKCPTAYKLVPRVFRTREKIRT